MSLQNPPARYRGLIRSIAALPDDRFQALLDALEALHEPISLRHFGERLMGEVALDEPEAKCVISLLHSMCSAVEASKHSQRECVEALARDAALGIAEADQNHFTDRVDTLLSRAPMRMIHSYIAVLDSYERMFIKAQITQEVRPILTEGFSGATVAMLTHTLRINLSTTGRTEDFYVTLDRNDLRALRALVDQALEADDAIAQGASVWRGTAPVPLGDWA